MKDLGLPYQQGDVLLFKVDSLPTKGLKKAKRVGSRFILAEGEVTGHAHAIADPNVDVMVDKDGNLFMEVTDKPVTLVHEEHGPIAVEPGQYRIGRVVEEDPFEDLIREVRD